MRKWIFLFLSLILAGILAGGAFASASGTADARKAGGEAGLATEADTQNPETEDLMPDPAAKDASSREDSLLRIGLSDPVSTMDVHRTTEDYMVPLNLYERLFDIQVMEDGTSQLVNGLAEDYTVSGDGLTYSFTLRGDAYYSDGTRVTASDVAFTFSRMLSLPESVQTDFADMILGAQDVMSGKADRPEGIHVLDDTHLQIELSEPFGGYIYQLASPSCSIMSESFVTKAGESFGSGAEQTMGSGPYMVTSFTRSRILMKKNPYYHCHEGEQLSASRVELLVLPPALMDETFRKGGIDLLDTNLINPDAVDRICSSDRWKDRIIARSRVEIQYLMMNVDEAPLRDVRIRRAVQMAINRQAILEELYGGDGCLTDGIFPRGLIGYNEENQGWLQYDPKEAKRLVSEVPDAGKIRLELAANTENGTRKLTMLEMIRQDLIEAGFQASIVSYDADSFLYLRKAGQLMAYLGEWSADFNDPDNFIYTFFGNRGKTLYRSSNYSNLSVLSRVARARTIQDPEKRRQEYCDLERKLVRDDAVWVPVISTEHLFVLGEKIESFSPFWAGWSSMYFRDVVLKDTHRS